jgi:hypothetical protein
VKQLLLGVFLAASAQADGHRDGDTVTAPPPVVYNSVSISHRDSTGKAVIGTAVLIGLGACLWSKCWRSESGPAAVDQRPLAVAPEPAPTEFKVIAP